jgi:hypothetical protein
VAFSVVVYEVPSVPPGSVVVEMASGGGAAIVMVSDPDVTLAGVGSESVTFTVNVEDPEAFGVPVIAPVLALRFAHAGKVPLAMLHV